jgi:hypothetical protein
VWVLSADGRRHSGWVVAARPEPTSGRWQGFVDYTVWDDYRTGGHHMHWLDEGRLQLREADV